MQKPGVATARNLRVNATDAERKLWRHLRNRQLGWKFRRQDPRAGYVADFICLTGKLIVEVDGGHHTPALDRVRTETLEREGFRILRFWDNDVLSNTEGVIELIRIALPPHPPSA